MRRATLVFIALMLSLPVGVAAAPSMEYAGAVCSSNGRQLLVKFSDSGPALDTGKIFDASNYQLTSMYGGGAPSVSNVLYHPGRREAWITLGNALQENARTQLMMSELADISGSVTYNDSDDRIVRTGENGFFLEFYANSMSLGGATHIGNWSYVDAAWGARDICVKDHWFWGCQKYVYQWDTPFGQYDERSPGPINNWSTEHIGFLRIDNNHVAYHATDVFQWFPQYFYTTGNWYFSTVSDDGVRLWLNNDKLIDNWTNHGDTRNYSDSRYLEHGKQYALKVHHYNMGRNPARIKIDFKRSDWSGYYTINDDGGAGYRARTDTVKTCLYVNDPAGFTAPSLSSFQVTAPSSGSTCAPIIIQIEALDQFGSRYADFTGQIALSTTTGHGDWSIVSGSGSLRNNTPDDGLATYTFASSDSGVVQLALENSHAETLSLTVTDGGVSRQSGNITFADNALEITSNDTAGWDVIANRDHAFTVRYLEDDGDPNTVCTTPNFNGTVNLRFYRNNSGAIAGNGQTPKMNNVSIGSSLAAAGQVPISFSAGVGAVTLSTTDIGQYSLSVVDDSKAFSSSNIVGESSSFTVRPFGFYVSAASNPGADNAAGAAFKKAGEAFTATIKAVGWQNEADSNYQPSGHNDSDPSNNANLANNPVLPGFGSAGESVTLSHGLVAPAGGQNGVLSGTTTIPASSFSNGVATINNLSWSEVGIIELSAQTDANFLSSGQRVIGKSGYVGRFYPDHFAISSVATPSLQNGNGSCGFTYQGQAFDFDVDPEFTITAQNTNNETTQNYTGVFWKLPSLTVDYAAPGAPAGGTTTSLSSDVTGQVINQPSNNGVSQFSASGAQFSFTPGASPGTGDAPFTTGLTISLNHGASEIQDADGACYQASGSCANYLINSDDSVAIRYGRLMLDNAQAPVTDALQMDYRAEYWTGTAFATNTLDNGSCGTSTVGAPALALVDPNRNLTLSDTSVSDTGTLVAGEGVITLTAPGADNDGQLAVTLQGPAWLQYDFDDNGTREQAEAIATFGIQKGNGPILHMREVYR